MKTNTYNLSPAYLYLGATLGSKIKRYLKYKIFVYKTNKTTSKILINAYNRLNAAVDAGVSPEVFLMLYCEELKFIDIYQEENIPKQGRAF